MPKKLNNQEFITKANKVHFFKYSYEKTQYKTTHIKIVITCPEHGDFLQYPSDHLRGHGCPECKKLILSKIKTKYNTQSFIKKASKIHNHLYSYEETIYQHCFKKIKIRCFTHGYFWQRPNGHLNGRGCPKCKSSKGEKQIEQWLKEHNIEFIPQKRFKDCKNKSLLPFDFYLPKTNICIEYDGIQHFYPTFGSKAFELTKINDKIKNKYCKSNDIRLIRIKYNSNISEKLSAILKIKIY